MVSTQFVSQSHYCAFYRTLYSVHSNISRTKNSKFKLFYNCLQSFRNHTILRIRAYQWSPRSIKFLTARIKEVFSEYRCVRYSLGGRYRCVHLFGKLVCTQRQHQNNNYDAIAVYSLGTMRISLCTNNDDIAVYTKK